MEGALSLMQMAKICAALARLDRAAAALHLGAHRSDDRRRHRQLRDARRPEYRRAEGAHRLRRPARHRADHPPEAAGRLSAQRVSARERHGRPRGRSPRNEGDDCASALRFMGAAPSAPRVQRPPARSVAEATPQLWVGVLSISIPLEQFGIKFGLENIATLVDALGRPERAFRSIHIAGTNGKGSVTAMVDTALGRAGHRSARYTSPASGRPDRTFRRGGTAGGSRPRFGAPPATCARRLNRFAATARFRPSRRFSKPRRPWRSSCSASWRRGRGGRSRAGRPTRLDQRHTPRRNGDHVDRFRSSAVPRLDTRRDRRGKSRHHQARRAGRRGRRRT